MYRFSFRNPTPTIVLHIVQSTDYMHVTYDIRYQMYQRGAEEGGAGGGGGCISLCMAVVV